MSAVAKYNKRVLLLSEMPEPGGLRAVDLFVSEVRRFERDGWVVMTIDKLSHRPVREWMSMLLTGQENRSVRCDAMALDHTLRKMGIDSDFCFVVTLEQGHVRRVAEEFGQRRNQAKVVFRDRVSTCWPEMNGDALHVKVKNHSLADRSWHFLALDASDAEVNRIGEWLAALAVARPDAEIRMTVMGGEDVSLQSKGVKIEIIKPGNVMELCEWLHYSDADLAVTGTNDVTPVLCAVLDAGLPVVAVEGCDAAQLVDDECGVIVASDCTDGEFVMGLAPCLDSDVRRKRMGEKAKELYRKLKGSEGFVLSKIEENDV